MTQAGVDLEVNNGELHRKPQPSARKRRSAADDDESSQDEDPSWCPSEDRSRQKKKRRHRPRDQNAHAALDPDLIRNNNLSQSSPVDSESEYRRPSSSSVRVELSDDCDVAWEDFRPLGTEMIICKEGRRMFPSVEVVMTGLEPSHIYSVLISVELTDSCRYRYNEEHGWLTITTGAQASIPPRMVPHRDSRNIGSHFMRNPLSFKTTKMTNNFITKRTDQLILLSMRKYIPIITVQCHSTREETIHKLYTCDFIAVTSYQRVEVTKLKIFTNRFAAAFRKRSTTPPEIVRRAKPVKSRTRQKTRKIGHSSSSSGLQTTSSNCNNRHSPLSLTGSLASAVKSRSGNSEDVSPEIDQRVLPNVPVVPSGKPATAHPPVIEYEEDDYIMEQTPPCFDSYFTDEPPHIRPFIFQPRYHCGLDPAYHPALLNNSRPPSRPPHPPPLRPPKYPPTTTGNCGGVDGSTGGVDQEMLWSSVAIFGAVDAATDDCFGLGLLGESL